MLIILPKGSFHNNEKVNIETFYCSNKRLFSDCQYVYDWQIPGRRFLHIRNRSDLICPARSGEPDRPDGHSIPQSYKMYIPQVWSFRQHPASRCLVRACPQHPQREDIHLPLVSNHCMYTTTSWSRIQKIICLLYPGQ